MLFEPRPTAYDIKFNLLGHAVRVNPLFFLLPVFFARGLASEDANLGMTIVLVAVMYFLSILVHEFGHALAFRYFGIHSRIVLYMMGGLAIPERGSWGASNKTLSPNQQMFVSFAGPLAGFILAGLLVLLALALGGEMVWWRLFGIPFPQIVFPAEHFANNPSMNLFINGGITINILLNLLNLVPVYPLDGGQIAFQFLGQLDQRDGQRNALYLSIATAGLLTVLALSTSSIFIALLFGSLAFNNYQMLQQFGGRRW